MYKRRLIQSGRGIIFEKIFSIIYPYALCMVMINAEINGIFLF